MEQLDNQIKNLHQKIQLLLKHNQALRKQNAALQVEKEKLQGLVHEKENTMQQLQQNLDAFNIAANSMDAGERKHLVKRLDAYLAEIDKCLSLLKV